MNPSDTPSKGKGTVKYGVKRTSKPGIGAYADKLVASVNEPAASKGNFVLPHSIRIGNQIARSELIKCIEQGLSFRELETLRVRVAVPMETLAAKLRISKATLHRRKASGRLDPGESDRVVRFALLMDRAVEVLESEENARLWLNAPQVGLGGAVPLDYAATEIGAREVENLLGRIEHGVFS